jgi:hypothetical protein
MQSLPRPEPSTEELADYRRWNEINPKLSLMGYVCHNLTSDLAIAVTKLFSPDMIVYDEGLFLADLFDEKTFRQWKAHLGSEIQAIERVMNHLHLCDMLPCLNDLDNSNIKYFGNVLTELWQCGLANRYQDRQVHVAGEWDEEEQDYVLTIFHTIK